jgi:hypothetical protein
MWQPGQLSKLVQPPAPLRSIRGLDMLSCQPLPFSPAAYCKREYSAAAGLPKLAPPDTCFVLFWSLCLCRD